MEKLRKTLGKAFIPLIAVATVVLVLILALGTFVMGTILTPRSGPKEVVTVATLEKIINVSELSTSTAVYNGIAEIMDEKDPEKTDYFVSYKAEVKVGINLEDVEISVDHKEKKITLIVPDVYITDLEVDITSMDFIFYDTSANASTVTQEAYRACEEDVLAECEQQDAIFTLAQQSACNALKALIDPFVEQLDEEYVLEIK